MLYRWIMAGAACTVAASAWSQSPSIDAPKAKAPAAQISPERLQAIRQQLLSQIAVYDAAENALRRPSAAEAAALAPAAVTAPAPLPMALPGGGVALRVDAANLDYLIVDVGADGKKTLRHGTAASTGSKATSKEGHRHAH